MKIDQTSDQTSEHQSGHISKELQGYLIQLAKASIGHYLEVKQAPNRNDLSHIKLPGPDSLEEEKLEEKLGEKLEEKRSAFVTLKLDGQLRGCIGSIFPSKPLQDEIMHQSVNAAFSDYRFNPVTVQEYPLLKIEISILTQPNPVEHIEDIQIQKHGIILKKNGKSALFLPKVASEQGWDLKTTLAHLCQKAGLELGEWQEGCEFLVFEAFEFKE